jgi:cold-inducible RNA-binding protein
MSVKLFVGNLPYQATDEELKQLFADYGDIEDAVVIRDRQTNRSKGFGFITLADDAAGQKAIEALNGSDYGGRNIVVNVARPPQNRSFNSAQ